MPGGQTTPYTRLYVITQENCINCPAAKAVINEAIDDTDFSYEEIDLLNMDPDFEFKLLENQIFIASTPSIVLDKEGALQLLYSGKVPTVEDIQKVLRGN